MKSLIEVKLNNKDIIKRYRHIKKNSSNNFYKYKIELDLIRYITIFTLFMVS
jgi:hypothetical protein